MEEFNDKKVLEYSKKYHEYNFFEIYSVALNIINQLKSINELEKKMLSNKPTPEQLQAGIKDFEILGDFATVDELAKGMPWRYKEIEDTEYNIIFAKLLKSNISRKFDKKYRDIMTAKK